MKHNLRISVRRNPSGNGIAYCRKLTLRERMMDRLFGEKNRMTVIVPGDAVACVSIEEIPEGGEGNEEDA